MVHYAEQRQSKFGVHLCPTQAIHCTLAEVTPLDGSSWSEKSTKHFISLVHQKLVMMVATGGDVL